MQWIEPTLWTHGHSSFRHNELKAIRLTFFLFLVGNGNAKFFREFTCFELSIRRREEANRCVNSLHQSVKHNDVLHDNPHLSDSVF